MNRLKWIFVRGQSIRPGWRVVLFIAIYIIAGKALDVVLLKVHFPDRAFTWSSLLLNYVLDFAFISAIAWIMSRIERERFSSYGLPLVPNAESLFARGVLWGFVPSALILVPIYFAGGCSFHGLALHGREFVYSAILWALAMLALGFGEEFLFRGYLLKTLGEGIGFWPAAIALSSLFGLVHLLFKPHEDWIDLISVG